MRPFPLRANTFCLLLLACLFLSLMAALLWPRQAITVTRQFMPDQFWWDTLPLKAENDRAQTLALRLTPPVPLASLSTVELLLIPAKRSEAARAESAVIDLPGRDCRLRAPAGYRLFEKTALPFIPEGKECEAPANEPLNAVLSLVSAGDAPVSVVTSRNVEETSAARALPEGDKKPVNITGYWTWPSASKATSRLELLVWMWDLGRAGPLIPVLLCLGFPVAWLGLALLAPGRRLSGLSPTLRVALAAFCFSGCLGAAYAVLIPPFHGPDEPAHYVSLASVVGQKGLAASGVDLAKRDHFERIRFRRYEAFTPDDRLAPYPVPWGKTDFEASEMEKRSLLTASLWRLVFSVLSPAAAGPAILAVRLANVAFFALFSALGVLVLKKAVPDRDFSFPLFVYLIPTLPFFAMHLSNYALFAGLTPFLGCLNLALFLREDDWPLSGLLLGLLSVILILTTYTGLPLLAWVAAMLACRFVLQACSGKPASRVAMAAFLFWGGFFLAFGCLFLVRHSPQIVALSGYVARIAARLPALAGEDVSAWLGRPLLLPTALALLVGLETVGATLLTRFRAWPGAARLTKAPLALMPAAAVLSGLFLVASWFLSIPETPNEMQHAMALKPFLACAATGFFTSLSFRQPDLFLSTTFWGAFGWHDLFLPPLLVRLLAGGAGLGLTLLALLVRKRRDARAALRLVFFALGMAAALLATAFSAYQYGVPNIHGRYLLGLYALLLSLGFAAYPLWIRRLAPRPDHPTTLATGFALCALLHAGSLLLIVHRYFD